jgi:shikimate kinase
LLQVADPQSRLRELYALRDPLYREVANHIIDGRRHHARQVVQLLTDMLREPCES